MKLQITHYAASWNPILNLPRLVVFVTDGIRNSKHEVPVETAQELTLLVLILQQTPVFIDTETKSIQSGIEQI